VQVKLRQHTLVGRPCSLCLLKLAVAEQSLNWRQSTCSGLSENCTDLYIFVKFTTHKLTGGERDLYLITNPAKTSRASRPIISAVKATEKMDDLSDDCFCSRTI